MPKDKTKCQALAHTIGADGEALWRAGYAPTAPASVHELPTVELLRRIWLQNSMPTADGLTWRDNNNIPPAASFVISPCDPDAHYARKHTTQWVGYTVHLTETCEDETPPLITHVETTPAPVDDSKVTAHTTLLSRQKGCCRAAILPIRGISMRNCWQRANVPMGESFAGRPAEMSGGKHMSRGALRSASL